MTPTNDQIKFLERMLSRLAEDLANQTEYEAAGLVLRASFYPREIEADPGLVHMALSLLSDAALSAIGTTGCERILRAAETMRRIYGMKA